MGERATERAAVAHRWVADLTGNVPEQGGLGGQQVARLEGSVLGHCADGDVITGVSDVRQVIETTDVDQHRRGGEPEPHERDQAVATGEEFRLVAVFGECRNGGFSRVGDHVVECCGDHAVPPTDSTALTMLW